MMTIIKKILLSLFLSNISIGPALTNDIIAPSQQGITKCLDKMIEDTDFIQFLNEGVPAEITETETNPYKKLLDGVPYRGVEAILASSTEYLSSVKDQAAELQRHTGFQYACAFGTLMYISKNCPENALFMVSDASKDDKIKFPYIKDTNGYIKFVTVDNWAPITENNKKNKRLLTITFEKMRSVIPGIYTLVATPKDKKQPGDMITRDEAISYGNFWHKECSDHWNVFNIDEDSALNNYIKEDGTITELGLNKRQIYYFDLSGNASDVLMFPGTLLADNLSSRVEEAVTYRDLYSAINHGKRLAIGLTNTACAKSNYELDLHVVSLSNLKENIENISMSNDEGWLNTLSGTGAAVGAITTLGIWGLIKGNVIRGWVGRVGSKIPVIGVLISTLITSYSTAEALYSTIDLDMAYEPEKVYVIATFPLNEQAKKMFFKPLDKVPLNTEYSRIPQKNTTSLIKPSDPQQSAPFVDPFKGKWN